MYVCTLWPSSQVLRQGGSPKTYVWMHVTGKNWYEQRKFFVSEMRKNSQAEIDRIVGEEANLLTERLRDMLDKDPSSVKRVSMHQFFMPATVNVVWRLSTGQSVCEARNISFKELTLKEPFLQSSSPTTTRRSSTSSRRSTSSSSSSSQGRTHSCSFRLTSRSRNDFEKRFYEVFAQFGSLAVPLDHEVVQTVGHEERHQHVRQPHPGR